MRSLRSLRLASIAVPALFTFGTFVGLTSVACSDDGLVPFEESPSGADPSQPGGGSSGGGGTGSEPVDPSGCSETQLCGNLTAPKTLTKDKVWLLRGLVTVKAGTTLVIEKGTVIKGESGSKAVLLVEAGAKIVAEGTADEPIVFTSQAEPGVRRAGDWGGVVVLGRAPVNVPGGKANVEGFLKSAQGTEYGGTDPEDDSGVLRFVRIEYSGILLAQDNEVNGLTLAGVGRKTKIDHVQVRHTLDDCFEFFGGTVDAKYLACQHNEDDGFDFDLGYQGRLQFLVLQQDPQHVGEDNGFEIDNDDKGTANEPFTSPTVYNATILGKNADVDNVQYGMLVRRNARGTYRNIVFSGFDAALDVRDAATAAAATDGKLSIQSSVVWNAKGAGVVQHLAFPETGAAAPNKDNDGAFDEVAWFFAPASRNASKDPGLLAPFDAAEPGFGPAAALLDGAATPPSDGFFDTSATFVGAFRDANDGWARAGAWAVWAAD